MKPYDWTYTTGYRGDVEGLEVAGTEERIDYEQLKKQERIEFYDDIILFEDELADNGTAVLNVKVVGDEIMQHLRYNISTVFLSSPARDGVWVLCSATLLPKSGWSSCEDQ